MSISMALYLSANYQVKTWFQEWSFKKKALKQLDEIESDQRFVQWEQSSEKK